MPLARIVTRFPERTLPASDYFRSHGYTVEIVSPGDFRVTPAALEITLGKCTPKEAFQRAKQALEALQPSAAAAEAPAAQPPPILSQTELSPTAFDIAGRPVEFEPTAERRQAGQSFVAALKSVLHRGWKGLGSAQSSKSHSESISSQVQQRVAEPKSGPAEFTPQQEAERAQIEQERRERAAAEERARLEREQRERAAREQAAREEQERQRLAREQALREERERVEREQRERAAAQERARVEGEERERAAREQAAREERERVEREQRERAAAAERERLDRERQERERVAAVHEALIAAQRERERAQAEQQATPISIESIQSPAAAAPRPALQQATATGLRAASQLGRRRAFHALVIAAIAAAILIAAGVIAYANRRPAAPLSNSDLVKSQSVRQQTPFGPATVAPPPPAPPKPTPAVTPQTPVRRSSTTSSHRSAKSRRAARRLRGSNPQNDPVAEDEVVVRHFSKTPPVTTSSAATGMKKYSDTN
jgi:hypothetical protein